MNNKYFLSCFLVLSFFTAQLFSQETAITESGKKVLLKPDKTWEYITDENSGKNDNSFRNSSWGMSIQQVKKTETLEIAQEREDAIIYKGRVANLDTYVMYIFTNNKLVRAKYVITESHINKNQYIQDYKNLKAILENKYGTPKSDKQLWLNDLYKNDYDDWGLAISAGHMRYYTEWSSEDTDIILALYGDNFEISLVTEYTSISLKGLEKKANEEQTLEDF